MLSLLSLHSCYALLALSIQPELEYHAAETDGSLYDDNEHNDGHASVHCLVWFAG